MYKYKISEFLDKLSVKEHKLLFRQISKEIGVSHNTFSSYSRILKNSKKDIPYGTVRKLEILFGMQNGELINLDIKGKHYSHLVSSVTSTTNY